MTVGRGSTSLRLGCATGRNDDGGLCLNQDAQCASPGYGITSAMASDLLFVHQLYKVVEEVI